MSDKSPLFVSAMELFAHATELYTAGKPRKYKFVILHLANAVELILKDRLVDKGISIYVAKQPQTINIWDSFQKLSEVGVVVAERPVIELLVDDRNTIQHRFGYPDAETVYFYLERIVAFLKRFLRDEYGLDLAEVLGSHLSEDDLSLLGLSVKSRDEGAALDRLLALSPESAVIQAFNLIERRVYLLLDPVLPDQRQQPFMLWQHPKTSELFSALAAKGYVSKISYMKIQDLRYMRNRAAHAAHYLGEGADSDIPDWGKGVQIAKEIISGLDRAIADGFALPKSALDKPPPESRDNSDNCPPSNDPN
jgi:hypothetical protein